MAFDAKGYRSAAMQAGIPRDTIEKTIADRTGVQGWFTGGKQGVGGVANSIGNVLNVPSYALGGMLNNFQDFDSKYRQGDQIETLGLIDGIKNKRAVSNELPESLDIDPSSAVGMGIGFTGEILTPNIPFAGAVSKVGKVGKVAKFSNVFSKAGSKATKVFSKAGKIGGAILQDAGRTLLEKSYKLSASDIDKIAEAIGATDEATKAQKVIDYLEQLGLNGANRSSLATLGKKIDAVQKLFNKLTKTGGQVSRTPYIEAMLNEAARQEKLGTPASRRLAEQLFKEAEYQQSQIMKPLTDTELTEMISKLWSDVKDAGISDPGFSSLNKSLAKSGSSARELLRPGSQKMGRMLRGMRTAEEVIGKKANTGLGTQLVNAFKPSAFGLGTGAGIGLATGNDPIVSGLVGMAGGMAINNPRVMNVGGKLLSKGIQMPTISSDIPVKAANIGASYYKKVSPAASRTAITAARLSILPESPKTSKSQSELLPGSSSSQRTAQSNQNRTSSAYKPIVPSPATPDPKKVKALEYKPPKSVFANKSAFGSTKKVTRGSFY